MAIAGFDGKTVSKKATVKNPNGQNMVAKSSYNSRTMVLDQNDNTKKYPHAPKGDLECNSQIILPPGAPERYKNPSILWSEIQGMKYENVGKAMILNLPHEATEEQRHEMVDLFIQKNLTSQYLVCQVDYHKPKMVPSETDPNVLVSNNNYHAHILTTELQMIGGEWADKKSAKPYVDKNGVPLQKTNTPKLKNKKLQYDSNGNILFKKGWQQLQYNEDGTPKLHDDGTPVLVDIRTPEKDDQGNQIYRIDKGKPRPVWKRKEIPAASVTQYGWIKDFRESWGECQNKIFKKHNILNKDGEIVQVDMRSYKKQDEEINDGMERIPQIKVFDPYVELTDDEKNNSLKTKQDIIKVNKKRKAHNEAINEIRKLRKEKTKLDDSIESQDEIEKKEMEIISQIAPRTDWTQTWVTQAEKLYKVTSSHYRYTNRQLSKTITSARKYIDGLPKKLPRKEQIERKRIALNLNLMVQLRKNIQVNNLTTPETIKSLADEAWDKLSDQQKVSFVRDRYGLETGKIYARVLARQKEDFNIIDGLEQSAPETPNEKTNLNIIRNEAEHFCETQDIVAYQNNAYAKWDTASYKAPPEELINVLNVYATVARYYTAKLKEEPWRPVSTVGGFNYNVEEIEKEARLANEQLAEKEAAARAKAKAERKQREEAEARAKAEAERKQREEAEAQAKAETERKQREEAAARAKAKAEAKREQQAQLASQAELQKHQAEYRKQHIRNNYGKLIPQYQVAVASKDQVTVNKLSALVRNAFTENEIKNKYKHAKSWRDNELNAIVNQYINIKTNYGFNEETKRELEKQFFDCRNKPIVRNINKAIAEHNQTASEYNIIGTKEYQKYSDEANFWYGVMHPNKTIRPSKSDSPAINSGTPEVQIEIPKSRPARGLPAPASQRSGTNQGWEVLPNGTTRPITIGPNTLKRGNDHAKSEMEKAEDELYQGWDPWKHGHGM